MRGIRSVIAWALAGCAGLLSSCSIMGLHKEVEALESNGGITVQVTPRPKGPAPTYVLAWRVENGKRKDSAGFHQLRPDGIASFNLMLNQSYWVGAFTDVNGNRAYDAGEPLGVVQDIKPLTFSDPNARSKIWPI